MNKKGAVFATMTVIFVFLFIMGNLIYKNHLEKKIKLEDVGLISVDLLRQRNDFEVDSYLIKKGIEYRVNYALFKFLENKDEEFLRNPKFNELFFGFLKGNEELLDYDFNLVGDVIEFNIKGFRGVGKIRDVETCKKKVVDLVKRQVGCRYVLGAKGPCESAFDCSGLVKWIFMNVDVGVNYFPDGSWIQADWGRRNNLNVDTVGKNAKLEIGKLEPGDTVFFRGSLPTDNHGLAEDLGIRHVGIYIGDGKMIEAAGKDKGVIESSVTRDDYRGAIRVCSESFEGKEGIFTKDFKYIYKIDLGKKKFATFQGLKSLI